MQILCMTRLKLRPGHCGTFWEVPTSVSIPTRLTVLFSVALKPTGANSERLEHHFYSSKLLLLAPIKFSMLQLRSTPTRCMKQNNRRLSGNWQCERSFIAVLNHLVLTFCINLLSSRVLNSWFLIFLSLSNHSWPIHSLPLLYCLLHCLHTVYPL